MTHRILSAPPYFERRLDIWKSCLLFFLFAVLLLSALFWSRLQPNTQLSLVSQPRALPTIWLDSIPTLLPTQTSVAQSENGLPQIGQIATDSVPTAMAPTTLAPTTLAPDVATADFAIADAAATNMAGTSVAATETVIAGTAIAEAAATSAAANTATSIQTPLVELSNPTATPGGGGTVPNPTATYVGPTTAPTAVGQAQIGPDLTLEASLIPLTFSYPPPNAALPAAVVSRLEGTGAPGTLIALSYLHCSACSTIFPDRRAPGAQATMLMQPLGSVLVDAQGHWLLPLSSPLPPGQHYVLLTQKRSDGIEIGTAAVSFTVLQEPIGPLALSIPMITFPAPAALINLSQLEDEQLIFHGAALPGQRIQLYINGAFVGETLTDTVESWHIPAGQPLSPGSYIAYVFSLDPSGNVVAESAPAAFVILRQSRG